MKAPVIFGTLVCACSLLFALPSFAQDNLAEVSQKAKIGIALPSHTAESNLLKDAFEARGYETALYIEDDNVVPQMISDGCNIIIVGSVNGHELDSQMEEAEEGGMHIAAYGSMLMNIAALHHQSLQIQSNFSGAALNLDNAAADFSRVEMFSGVLENTPAGSEIYSALTEINPYIDNDAVLMNSGVIGRSILDRSMMNNNADSMLARAALDRTLDDSRAMLAQSNPEE